MKVYKTYAASFNVTLFFVLFCGTFLPLVLYDGCDVILLSSVPLFYFLRPKTEKNKNYKKY